MGERGRGMPSYMCLPDTADCPQGSQTTILPPPPPPLKDLAQTVFSQTIPSPENFPPGSFHPWTITDILAGKCERLLPWVGIVWMEIVLGGGGGLSGSKSTE